MNNTNYKTQIKELDKKISNVQAEIDKVNNSALKGQKANMKKLFDIYEKAINELPDNVIVFDDRFNKFWKCPAVLKYDSVREKISEAKPKKDNEYYNLMIGRNGGKIGYLDFELYTLKHGSQQTYSLKFIVWDEQLYLDEFNKHYGRKDTCGILQYMARNFYDDIMSGQICIEYKVCYDEVPRHTEDSEYQYYIYSCNVKNSQRVYYAYDDENYKIDFDKRVNQLLVQSRHLLTSSSCVKQLVSGQNSIDVSCFPDTQELKDTLNDLNRLRRINFRLDIYNTIDELEINYLNILSPDGLYQPQKMRNLQRFQTSVNLIVYDVWKVQVLKRLESKVKVRIFIDKVFHNVEGKLIRYGSSNDTRVYVPMFIDRTIDIRLYIDFIQQYIEAKQKYGLLEMNKLNLDNVKFSRVDLFRSQMSNVDNWNWEFPKEVSESYDISELTLIEW